MPRVLAVFAGSLAAILAAYWVYAVLVAVGAIDGGGDVTALTFLLIAAIAAITFGLTAAARALWRRGATARPCPRCGRSVTIGTLDCVACDFDFRTVGA